MIRRCPKCQNKKISKVTIEDENGNITYQIYCQNCSTIINTTPEWEEILNETVSENIE